MAYSSDQELVGKILPAVVQIVALKKGMFGNASTAWTGSGTVVHPQGIILTNCHVANPRAMGMPAPNASQLAVSITGRSDEPPALTYIAEIMVQSPQLDLAVLRITRRMDGKAVGKLNLPYIPLGDSDRISLAEELMILGYPGIGGQTVTFTQGSVAGFTGNQKMRLKRAWIKTDATIAGGNSGGTAVDNNGYLVGIPTQAAAGDNIVPVDARPVVDTNRDGRVDQRDAPIAIGGFINGLRPINLAKPLLKKAGVPISGAKVQSVPMEQPAKQSPSRSKQGTGIQFSNLVFSTKMSRDGRPINAADILPAGTKTLYASFQFRNMRKGTKWRQVWTHNGKKVLDSTDSWKFGASGATTLTLSNKTGLPEGEYQLAIAVGNKIVAQGKCAIGRFVKDTDTQISGVVGNAKNRRAIEGALVIALKPNVRVMDFVKHRNKQMALTSAKTDRNGRFVFPDQLPKGQAYGLVVIARGYKDLVVESGIRIGSDAPEKAQMQAIPLQPE